MEMYIALTEMLDQDYDQVYLHAAKNVSRLSHSLQPIYLMNVIVIMNMDYVRYVSDWLWTLYR